MTVLGPRQHPGRYVFTTVPVDTPGPEVATAVFAFISDDDRTLVLHEAEAVRLGLAAGYPCAWITVAAGAGRLARVTAALAARGIAANPVSAVHDVHLFVPHELAAEALALLRELDEQPGSPVEVPGGFEIDDDPARVDREVVWEFLSTEAYWGRSRTRQDVQIQIDRAWRVVGAYRRSDGGMVGFARAISDGVAFGYLADVFVLGPARGAGLGRALVETIIDDPRVRWVLFTDDAHGLYERLGFVRPDHTCLVRPAQPGT